ncbi:MAG: hypothetical protein R3189_09380 [Thiomicrorhabdus chilensis]|uniref:hypothetical protein n=1 Tax=Thiomicrorhabdus chilensis TaxID=63656 RepID=UPI00299D85EB|nr:hypothetical protein [Thiomicrorhabdus chilensis]MDX1348445.1 hypothetical protein [Thiomicrorhabdus chilensis]
MKTSNVILTAALVYSVGMSPVLAAEVDNAVQLQSQQQVEQQLKQQNNVRMGPENPAGKKQIQHQYQNQKQYTYEKEVRSDSPQNGMKSERGVVRSESRPANRMGSGSMGSNGSGGGKR